jgi:hypothetical protein
MFIRFPLNLLILVAILDRFFIAAQQQDSDYWCSMCAGPGVAIESYNYTPSPTQEVPFFVEDANSTHIMVYTNICHGVDDLSFVFNSTCYELREDSGLAQLDCTCNRIQVSAPPSLPPTAAPQQQPFTVSLPPSAGAGAIVGYSIAGLVFWATASSLA